MMGGGGGSRRHESCLSCVSLTPPTTPQPPPDTPNSLSLGGRGGFVLQYTGIMTKNYRIFCTVMRRIDDLKNMFCLKGKVSRDKSCFRFFLFSSERHYFSRVACLAIKTYSKIWAVSRVILLYGCEYVWSAPSKAKLHSFHS